MEQALELELAALLEQERRLVFDRFTSEDALALGLELIRLGRADGRPIAIDIGLGGRRLFHFSFDGATPDNDLWLARKQRVVHRFLMSSRRMLVEMRQRGATPEQTFGAGFQEYAASGGAFPITLRGAGVVGAAAVSGLHNQEDHALVVAGLEALLGRRE